MFYRLKQLILVLGDIVCLSLGFLIAISVRHWAVPSTALIMIHQNLFAWSIFLWLVVNYINGLYDVGYQSNTKRFYRRLFETSIISLIVGIIFFYVVPSRDITPKTILLLTVFFGYLLSAAWRYIADHLVGLKKLQSKVVFIGYTDEVKELIDILKDQPTRGYEVRAVIDPRNKLFSHDIRNVDTYSSLKAIRPAISAHKIQMAIIAPHIRENEEAMRELYELLFWPVQLMHLPAFYELITGRIPPSTFSEGWFLDHLRHSDHPVYDKWRSLLDYVAAFFLGLIFLIVLPFVALAIKIDSKGSIFYKQERVGQSGKNFMLYKFRSMYELSADGSADVPGITKFTEKDDVRITPVGNFIRKMRLDELPQALNLIKRDVTLIGPRPERPSLVKEFTEAMPYYPLRHVVRPGLTGWSVLHQHYADSVEASLIKLQYDLYYIKNRSFLLDVSIVLRTFNIVIRLLGQ